MKSLTELIVDLEKYQIKGTFQFKFDDILSKVCDIPICKECSGIYLFYENGAKLIYTGISGRKNVNGGITHRRDGLRGRFLTGKQFGDLRSKTLSIQMRNETISFLEIKWFVTYGGQSFDIPRPIEQNIIRAHKTENIGLRPRWNKRD